MEPTRSRFRPACSIRRLVPSSDSFNSSVSNQAAQWAARLDRGLSPAEQDAYLQWLREDPVHRQSIAQINTAWARLDSLTQWRPRHSQRPNPDLLARKSRHFRLVPVLAALAASLALLAVMLPRRSAAPPEITASRPGLEPLALPDGSLVELKADAQIETRFTEHERRVRLLRGEAYFTVAKNPAKPFLVTTAALTLRATGTAFAASVEQDAVSVLVTEGRVRLEQPDPVALLGTAAPRRALPELTAGEEGFVRTARDTSRIVEVKVRELTPAELERALAWRTMRLEFNNLPLRDVVAELNRYSTRKLIVSDAETGAILIGGNFKTHNTETFARMLVAGFNVESETRGDDIVLRRRD